MFDTLGDIGVQLVVAVVSAVGGGVVTSVFERRKLRPTIDVIGPYAEKTWFKLELRVTNQGDHMLDVGPLYLDGPHGATVRQAYFIPPQEPGSCVLDICSVPAKSSRRSVLLLELSDELRELGPPIRFEMRMSVTEMSPRQRSWKYRIVRTIPN
jgi:hypothetical protein